jgi:hypothetical protein
MFETLPSLNKAKAKVEDVIAVARQLEEYVMSKDDQKSQQGDVE